MKRPVLANQALVIVAATALTMLTAASVHASTADGQGARRDRLAKTVEARILATHWRRDTHLAAVVAAIRTVPRHLLVPADLASRAYEDTVLPIGYGQTISDPYIVAAMTDLLRVGRNDTVLEVGTGSGYQAAILGQIVRHVYTIEIVEPLATLAKERLHMLGYDNVTVKAGDGYAGWPDHAPFDAIVVTAGATCLPPALVEQLKPGGRMVIPLGTTIASEELLLITKRANGAIQNRSFGRVMFVDFTGKIDGATRPTRWQRRDWSKREVPIRMCDA